MVFGRSVIPNVFDELKISTPTSQENGLLKEYGLATEGFGQARLAGELFSKVPPFTFVNFHSSTSFLLA